MVPPAVPTANHQVQSHRSLSIQMSKITRMHGDRIVRSMFAESRQIAVVHGVACSISEVARHRDPSGARHQVRYGIG
jgi:hypothetical protein